MRLMQRTLRTVTVHTPAGLSQERYTWSAGTPLRAAIYPADAAIKAQLSGERLEETRILLCENPAALEIGMGVCVEAADGKPDFRVVELERWTHARALLRRIPDGKRG